MTAKFFSYSRVVGHVSQANIINGLVNDLYSLSFNFFDNDLDPIN